MVSSGVGGVQGLHLSSAGVLRSLLFAHLLLVSFQIPLRAIVVDSTYIRDVLLLPAIGLWGFVALGSLASGKSPRLDLLDVLVALYLLYGILMILIAYESGLSWFESFVQFRNSFLPVALFFVARKSFVSGKAQAKLVNLLLIIALAFILDVVIEFAVFQMGLSKDIIPWYPHMFRVSYRFIGNETELIGYVRPEDSPVLGLLGWPHYTAATLVALFAFSSPFLAEKHLKNVLGGSPRLNSRLLAWLRRTVWVLAVTAVLALGVKLHILSFLIVLLLVPFVTNRKLLRKNLGILVFGSAILAAIAGPFASNMLVSVRQTFGNSLAPLFVKEEWLYVAGSPLQRLFFGTANLGSEELLSVGGFESHILLFTATYGLIWLVLFLAIYARGFFFARKLMRSGSGQARLFAAGTIGLLAVYLLDMGHYARTMYFPNIDIWAVCLGTLSALAVQPRQYAPLMLLQRRNSSDLPVTGVIHE